MDIEKTCDYCGKELGDEIWELPDYLGKCCSPGCLAFLYLNPRKVSWVQYLESIGQQKWQ